MTSLSNRNKDLGAGGFTLIELLVVMAILGMVLGLAPRLIPRSQGIEMEALTRQLANDLRQTRSRAIRQNQTMDITFDLAERSYWTGSPSEVAHWPDWVQIDVTAASTLTSGNDLTALRFFANGSSTGGRVLLTGGGRQSAIDLAWLTGAVAIRQVASE